MEENKSYLEDMERELELDDDEDFKRIMQDTFTIYGSQMQRKRKGKLIAHFTSSKKFIILGIVIYILFICTMLFLIQFSLLFLIPVFIITIISIKYFRYLQIYEYFYIDIYEKAIEGRVKIDYSKKPKNIFEGICYFKRAFVKENILYIVIFNNNIYYLKNFKNEETIAYLINKQIAIDVIERKGRSKKYENNN